MHELILSCNYNHRPVYNNWSLLLENNSEIKNLHAAEQDYNWEISHYLVLKSPTKAFHAGILEQQLEISVAKNVPRYIVCSRPTMYEWGWVYSSYWDSLLWMLLIQNIVYGNINHEHKVF